MTVMTALASVTDDADDTTINVAEVTGHWIHAARASS
jgi:hypothetical protein